MIKIQTLERSFAANMELWNKLKKEGWYITNRGEGSFWILNTPGGLKTLTGPTRDSIIEKLHTQFE